MPYYKVCPQCKLVASPDDSTCVQCGQALAIEYFSFLFDPYLGRNPIRPVEIEGDSDQDTK